MYIGRKKLRNSENYSDYIASESLKTIRTGKFLILFGIPSLLYFIYQDLHVVQIPELVICRVVFLIPFLVYGVYLFSPKLQSNRVTEFLHTVLLFSLILMAVGLITMTLDADQGISFNTRQAMNGLIINTFIAFIFSGVSRRWLHLIFLIPNVILAALIFQNDYFPNDKALAFLSNFIFVTIILIFRSFQLTYVDYERYMDKLRLKISNRELDILFNSQQNGIVVVDADTHSILKVNESASKMIDLPQSEILGHICHNFICPNEKGNCPISDRGLSVDNAVCSLIKGSGEPMPILKTVIKKKIGSRDVFIESFSDISKLKEAEEEKEKLIAELKTALAKIKTMSGLLPICSSCKKIRDDSGYWSQVEEYIHEHSDVEFSHSLCPSCVEELYGNEDWYKEMDKDKDKES